jgi:hypothetical protein
MLVWAHSWSGTDGEQKIVSPNHELLLASSAYPSTLMMKAVGKLYKITQCHISENSAL